MAAVSFWNTIMVDVTSRENALLTKPINLGIDRGGLDDVNSQCMVVAFLVNLKQAKGEPWEREPNVSLRLCLVFRFHESIS